MTAPHLGVADAEDAAEADADGIGVAATPYAVAGATNSPSGGGGGGTFEAAFAAPPWALVAIAEGFGSFSASADPQPTSSPRLSATALNTWEEPRISASQWGQRTSP